MSTGEGSRLLEVRELNKRYGRTPVLKDLDLQLEAGSIHGLVGLNGSGKTTTLECILGCLPYESGYVRVLGQRPDQLWRARGGVVGIFDTPGLHPGLTVQQTLAHARLLCPRAVRTAAEVAELLGIGRYRDYRIRELSLGNRRRASIAQALLGDPSLVILDEPFNGLDAGGVDDVLALIARMNREHSTTFLLSSHQLPYLEHVCSHMAILHQGRIVLSGHVDTLFAERATRVYLQCDPAEDAIRVLDGMKEVTRHPDDKGRLCLELGSITAADVNRHLVSAGINVSGLLTEKPSLDSLFREITSDGATSAPGREEAA